MFQRQKYPGGFVMKTKRAIIIHMMKTLRKPLILSAVVLLAAMETAPAQVLDQPVAIVRLEETVNIGQRELQRQVRLLEQQLDQTLSVNQRREVLDARIAEVLILQAAERDGIVVSQAEINQGITQQRQSVGPEVTPAQFRDVVQQQLGLNWDEYTEQLEKRLIQEKYILQTKRSMFESVEQPSDREIRRVYEENAAQFINPAMIRFNHIYFDTRESTEQEETEQRTQAESLYRRIREGDTTFDEVADQAMDNAAFGSGDFGYLIRGDQQAIQALGTDFVENIFDLERGDLGGVLESRFGFHIVQIRDKRSPRMLELDDPLLPGQSMTVRRQITNYLMMEQQQALFERALREIVGQLRDEAEITVFEENLEW
jgi:peptidyl-prolyl cis-trans isomerase SurA